MSVYGTGNYGKVDRIPGVGHVCTQFFHINFVPLFPVGSYFLFEGLGDGTTGVSIPWSGKSILIGWLRGALIVGALIAGFGGLIYWLDSKDGPRNPLVAVAGAVGAVMLVALFLWSYRISWIATANYERAVALGRTIGFTPETMLMIEIMHGRMTAEQADAELARLDEAAGRIAAPAEMAEDVSFGAQPGPAPALDPQYPYR